ncbi:HVA22-like protein e [Daucus carota subsp. sativus]|uniref:HVA22-like protein e n=1 Tax=Daucus carota subsp. sativus TaxID=79200 RepID=UPI0007EFCEE0|nr:PREDICTED: HVA22-like protein e [Daucus carota subsp. sativus]
MGSRLWTLLGHAHTLAGPATMLMYPLYASVIAMETTSKLDDQQWLAYWILYSFLTLLEMLLQPLLEWIPIWYDIKLVFAAWLVLPQFRGAAFIYEKIVREKLFKINGDGAVHSPKLFKANGDGAAHSPKQSPNSSRLRKLISFSSQKKGKST